MSAAATTGMHVLITQLGNNGSTIKRTSNGWQARCPAHEDKVASLSVAIGRDRGIVLHCKAGCETADVVRALGMTLAMLAPDKDEMPPPQQRREVARYDYCDESGETLYTKIRYEPKGFATCRRTNGATSWSLGDTRRVLYRLPELIASPSASVAFLTEGEKDADNVAALGLTATTTLDGASGRWLPEYTECLRGRRVVILPDNDAPGEKYAQNIVAQISGAAESVLVLRLPGLPDHGDVSDWIARGGTAEQLLALVNASVPPLRGFHLASRRLPGERAERLETGRKLLTFGIPFLDDATGGIFPSDVILIGAKTGLGKTSLVTSIAQHNSSLGRRVHYFALEAEDREIERRIKYRILVELYYADPRSVRTRRLRFVDWMKGALDNLLGSYEDEADKRLAISLARVKTFYRLESFTSDDFASSFASMAQETDLVILDHLHYVDTKDDDNENRGYKQIIKQIRDSALAHKKPVIVVAHVRKSDRRFSGVIPTIEDFHGSSDVPKIATKALMLAPGGNAETNAPHLWPTYMQIGKCRTDGSVTRYVARITYDAQADAYLSDYDLGRLDDDGKTFNPLAREDVPDWAVAGTRNARMLRTGQ